MTKLDWQAPGIRRFEAGVDRGVMYPKSGLPRPWPGLISVEEQETGGDIEPVYYDGIKQNNISGNTEFRASVETFSPPPEFELSNGVKEIAQGLFVAQQPRDTFHFSYRTLMGNELEGTKAGYKVHLVYNVTAQAENKTYSSLNDSPETDPITLNFETVPVPYDGIKPAAHFVVDTTRLAKAEVSQLEDALYGTPTSNPFMPTILQLVQMLGGL